MRILPGILIAVILLIVYGSLYPWNFIHRDLTESPIRVLLHSWHVSWDRRFLSDFIVNVALYVPLGMAAYLALWRESRRSVRLFGPVLLGTVLSASIEMTQIFTPSRDCSAFDLVNNLAGSVVGVLAGLLFERVARPTRWRVPDRAALGLLFCWLASEVFPLFPVTSIPVYRAKLNAFATGQWPDMRSLVMACALWYAAGCLMRAAGFAPARRWAVFSLVLIPAQIVVISRQPMPSQLAGAAIGVALFCAARSESRVYRAGGWAFLLTLAASGLTPFHFAPGRQAFSWVPFRALLASNWQTGAQLLLEKVFRYGTAIWLINASVRRPGISTLIVATLLAAVEVAQTRLPGRTPEVTDPLLALLLGAAIWCVHIHTTSRENRHAGV